MRPMRRRPMEARLASLRTTVIIQSAALFVLLFMFVLHASRDTHHTHEIVEPAVLLEALGQGEADGGEGP